MASWLRLPGTWGHHSHRRVTLCRSSADLDEYDLGDCLQYFLVDSVFGREVHLEVRSSGFQFHGDWNDDDCTDCKH